MVERIPRVNRLIREELSQILLKEVDFPENVLVTVTRVETSPDLNQAKAYISVMPAQRSEEVLNILNRTIYFIQQKLNKKLNMRPLPRLLFSKEEKTREAGRIEEILEKIKKEK